MGGGGGTQTNLGGTPVNPGSSAGVIPQFGSGGLMPYTGLAHLEKGEWVLTPDEVRASMRFGATSFGSPGAFSSSGQTPSIGTLQNNFYGVQNPQQLAQMVHELVKQAVARAAP
jgi:hypothetical protein